MINNPSISASLVIYNNDINEVISVIECVRNSSLTVELYIVDNSTNNVNYDFSHLSKVSYLKSTTNIGFGAGHNLILNKVINKFTFHLILNPDISFDTTTIQKLLSRINASDNIGLISPKILNPVGSLQYLCRLLPTPFSLFFRLLSNFIPFPLFSSLLHKYELRFCDYNTEMNVPFLSGCFMLLRTSVLKEIGFFDDRFFLYMEDLDLSRRIHSSYVTLYYPEVSIMHIHHKESFKRFNVFYLHLRSAILYFNKWGWFYDKSRSIINSNTLNAHGNNYE